jgi:hypothetical protein
MNIIKLFKTVKCRDAEKNRFFTGIINALIICLPFWMIIAYIIYRW